jgi:syntaxin 1B/2/3
MMTISPSPLPYHHLQVSSLNDGIRVVNENVDRVKEFHNRLLSELDDHQHQSISSQLAALTSETSRLTRNLKNRIRSLQSSISNNLGTNNGDANVRATQVGALKKRFMDAIMKYATGV